MLLSLLITFALPGISSAQPDRMAQLRQKRDRLQQHKGFAADTAYANTLNEIAEDYASRYPDSAILLLQDHTERYRLSGYKKGEIVANQVLGVAYLAKGDYEAALQKNQSALTLAEQVKDDKTIAGITGDIGLVYLNQGNYQKALQQFYASQQIAGRIGDKNIVSSSLNNIAIINFYQGKMKEAEQAYLQTLDIAKSLSDTFDIALAYNNLGEVYIEQKQYHKALAHLNLAYGLVKQGQLPELEAPVSNSLGATYLAMDSLPKALACYHHALSIARQLGKARAHCKALLGLAKVYARQKNNDLALTNALEGLHLAETMGQVQLLRDANEIVSSIYEAKGEGNTALTYYRKYKFFSDSLVNIENERAAANYKANFEYSQKEMAFQQESSRQRWIIFSSMAILCSLLIIVWVINRSRKRIGRSHVELQQQSAIIEEQKVKAEKTLNHLRTTQAQLIQSEKMASLGELTAGIAHEIQNPLNFVNNFSEVSKELLQEMSAELDRGQTGIAKEIAADVAENLDRIASHGKRADSIVKGMLQHSRKSTGQKEPTDINALVEEYTRLSYHGLRAKDKTFNATMRTDFDAHAGQLLIVPQEIGRVILNILTNAFYAVAERKKTEGPAYRPTIAVQTRKTGEAVTISVADNGTGIPAAVAEKIFQPFFTTKPSGQGTGLGLSLSYDIVTKGHGGTLTVKDDPGMATQDGKGTLFVITLPAAGETET